MAEPKQEIGTSSIITSYYTYKNREFKRDLIYYTNVETNWKTVVSGSNAADASKSIFNFWISLSGFATGTVGLASALFS